MGTKFFFYKKFTKKNYKIPCLNINLKKSQKVKKVKKKCCVFVGCLGN